MHLLIIFILPLFAPPALKSTRSMLVKEMFNQNTSYFNFLRDLNYKLLFRILKRKN